MSLHQMCYMLIVLSAVVLRSHIAGAATIQHVSAQEDAECNFRLTGEIKDGDPNKIKAIEKSLWGQRLRLGSPGGSYSEGLRIAKHFISGMLVTTVVENGAECYSACALIFMAGHGHITREEFPSRFLHVGGKLGFHSPFPDWSTLFNARYSKADVKAFYDTAMRASQQMIEIFSIVGHNGDTPQKSKWMKPSLISMILATPSDQLLYVDTVGKSGNWEIALVGYKEIDRLDQNLARRACVNQWYWHADVHGIGDATRKFNGSIVEAYFLRANIGADSDIEFVMRMNDGGTGPECAIKSRPSGGLWGGYFKAEGWYDPQFEIASLALFPLDTPLRSLLPR